MQAIPSQKIWYLPPINLSPTSLSVVAETLNIAQQVACECKNYYLYMTYDLAIAKIAFQIQSTESPKYNNLFIHLGSFHIQFALFKAIGKYLDESGGPYILSETGLLAQGSMKGFIGGTHFNRCRRIHPLLSTALQAVLTYWFIVSQYR